MTPKEKAQELFNKMLMYQTGTGMASFDSDWNAICSAIIAVDEIIRVTPSVYVTNDEEIYSVHRQYWEQVKAEIEKL